MATAITFVGVGASSATDGATNPAPGNPAGLAVGDFKICVCYTREVTDGDVTISAGWTEIVKNRNSGGLLAVWYKFEAGGDAAPTLTLVNHALNDTAMAQIAAWRGVHATVPIDKVGSIGTNAAQSNIGALPTIAIGRKVLVLAIGGKLDDWTSVAPLSGSDGLTWSEIAEVASTLGTDAGFVWDYSISEQLELVTSAYTFSVTGGTSVAGKGILMSFALDAAAFAAATDLVFYCAEAHPVNDGGAPGGSVDTAMRAVFTDLAANDDIEAISDNASDTNILAYAKGRDNTGAQVEEFKTMNGTTAIIFSTLGLIDDMLEFRLMQPALGNITVRRSVAGTTIGVIPIGELGFRRLFIGAYAHPSNSKDYYEKIFIKNNHPTVTLENASIVETADPGAFDTFTLAASEEDAAFATDRLTAPAVADTNPDTFDATEKFLSGDANLDPDVSYGVWVKHTIPAAQAQTKNTYTLTIAGDTAI